ncbi:MAG: phosphatidate cytidylyltransferase [Clostridia bacterium]|nr:phosphatidate cytidylyltransferase [Clostridia bacterium]
MKTRIISAAVMISFVVAVLTVGKLYFPLIITFFIALISGVGIYELLRNVAKIQERSISLVASVYSGLLVLFLDKNFIEYFCISKVSSKLPVFLSIVYFIFAVIVILYKHKEFSLEKIFAYSAFPFFVSFGFSCLDSIICDHKGIYYLLLLVNFASICDTGAYFVGSFFGKHKLCPQISPKKTVEGAIGGIASSIVISVVLIIIYSSTHIFTTIIATVILCIVGMMGDLFASSIKRCVGIKDYSNLIPGHGGILDRFDSMLLISPVLYMLIEFGVI